MIQNIHKKSGSGYKKAERAARRMNRVMTIDFSSAVDYFIYMKIPADVIVSKFLRTYPDTFSAKEFEAMLSRIGVKTSLTDCEEFLEGSVNVFALADGTYATRACAFTGAYFSFRPTRKEIDKGAFIAGHRCIPFVDPDAHSCRLTFLFNGAPLPRAVIEIDSNTALDLFALYGEEFEVQYIAADPANAGLDLSATDFSLPSKIKLSGFSIEPLVRDAGFQSGDRLLCAVRDWDAGTIDVSVLPHNDSPFQMNAQDMEREQWYSVLEQCLLESFDNAGPRASIEEQLAFVFADKRSELCGMNCGAVEELFRRSKKIGFEPFGVETRLWRKGEDVPAVGTWNSCGEGIASGAENSAAQQPSLKQEAQQETGESIRILAEEQAPDYLVDAYLKDALYAKQDDFIKILLNLYPNFFQFPSHQQKLMLLHLETRHGILVRDYNRFADFDVGEIRHKALELYSAVNELVCSIDMAGTNLAHYPQQPLVILSQIFGHVMHIIEMIQTDPASVIREMNEVTLSLEGMEFNFEEISGQLKSALYEESQNGFSIIK
ncbi:MAG: hypothetical protein K2H09_09385 [Treponemataceae bacterium]|nr:hypothetical protein [Treponemataceae bacterium]